MTTTTIIIILIRCDILTEQLFVAKASVGRGSYCENLINYYGLQIREATAGGHPSVLEKKSIKMNIWTG